MEENRWAVQSFFILGSRFSVTRLFFGAAVDGIAIQALFEEDRL
jgi:hypothetical protein